MIHGDNNVLKALLEKGYFELQYQLIDLYVGNLQAFGSMAAFTAGCAYTSIGEIEIPKTGTFIYAFHYLFDIFIHVTLALSVFATSQSALVLIYGPTKGFKGAHIDTVKIVQATLLEQRNFIMLLFLCMLGTTYLSLVMNFICKVPWQTSTSTSIVFLVGFLLTLAAAASCYRIFNPDRDAIRRANINAKAKFTDQFPGINYQSSPTDVGDEDNKDDLEMKLKNLQEKIKHFKANGLIFWREDLDDNTPLKLRYASLSSGKVDIYKHEKAFMTGEDPLNARSLDLSQYAVETDYNHFPKGNTTASSWINNATAGQSEFSVLEIATSEYDLVQAIKKFRLFLIPRVLNEVKPLKIIEFMCTDEEAYKQWISALKQGCRYAKALDDLKQEVAEEFDSHGVVDVELVLKRSNSDVCKERVDESN
eukprot:CAMPEP_0114466858 /NCGR_PEP_ID=MMETSP0104-20121206/9302_1 /TAXON_ID=37642 ORGANISM="Paraphysomonas imperforata, Strain PA2" /NCGR_SAMPLE_ID=MMETSP0104 /ASSEMBLY_ACC=CAM_ASM_000202 /LENGTH=420 /DNA_ID=CAMNT_0001640263 /DNA_START=82 /DNA_END=1347 /DNA_ORIENTATION=+